MKKLTALLTAMMALAMVTGSAMAAETMGTDLEKQLSPYAFGVEPIADGVSRMEIKGSIDTHYGVAPVWEGRTEDSLTMAEKAEKELKKQLSPYAFGVEPIADGVSVEDDGGLVDKHYGIAPAWEARTEDPFAKELGKHLSPYAFDVEPIAD